MKATYIALGGLLGAGVGVSVGFGGMRLLFGFSEAGSAAFQLVMPVAISAALVLAILGFAAGARWTPELGRIMTRKPAIAGMVALLALIAGVVAVGASRGPTMRSKLDQIRKGMTHTQVIAVLGKPDGWLATFRNDNWVRYDKAFWRAKEGTAWVRFDDEDRAEATLFDRTEPLGVIERVRSWFGW
jgi:SmpA / OmlA family